MVYDCIELAQPVKVFRQNKSFGFVFSLKFRVVQDDTNSLFDRAVSLEIIQMFWPLQTQSISPCSTVNWMMANRMMVNWTMVDFWQVGVSNGIEASL